MRALELLAPAKNLECGIAAIDHGADAVYIGAQKFGARVAAGNNVDDIRQLCTYAHQFSAKVYVTVNTIIYDDELEATRQLLQQMSDAGVDAILVQDMAILSLFSHLSPLTTHLWLVLVSKEWCWLVSCLSRRLPRFMRKCLMRS